MTARDVIEGARQNLGERDLSNGIAHPKSLDACLWLSGLWSSRRLRGAAGRQIATVLTDTSCVAFSHVREHVNRRLEEPTQFQQLWCLRKTRP